MPRAIKRDIFKTSDGKPMVFNVKGCQDVDLQDYIEHGGGVVDNADDIGPYTITLVDCKRESQHSNVKQDTFASAFILKCCIQNTTLSLKKFRLNESLYHEGFDPDQILHRRITWEDAKQWLKERTTEFNESGSMEQAKDSSNFFIIINNLVPLVVLDKIKLPSEHNSGRVKLRKMEAARLHKSSSCGSDSSDESQDDEQTSCGKTVREFNNNKNCSSRNTFTQDERERIISYIVQHECFDKLGQQSIWRRMSVDFPRHTWQSLKTHFRKKILPFIWNFNLPAEVVVKITSGFSAGNSTVLRQRRKFCRSSSSDSDSLSELSLSDFEGCKKHHSNLTIDDALPSVSKQENCGGSSSNVKTISRRRRKRDNQISDSSSSEESESIQENCGRSSSNVKTIPRKRRRDGQISDSSSSEESESFQENFGGSSSNVKTFLRRRKRNNQISDSSSSEESESIQENCGRSSSNVETILRKTKRGGQISDPSCIEESENLISNVETTENRPGYHHKRKSFGSNVPVAKDSDSKSCNILKVTKTSPLEKTNLKAVINSRRGLGNNRSQSLKSSSGSSFKSDLNTDNGNACWSPLKKEATHILSVKGIRPLQAVIPQAGLVAPLSHVYFQTNPAVPETESRSVYQKKMTDVNLQCNCADPISVDRTSQTDPVKIRLLPVAEDIHGLSPPVTRQSSRLNSHLKSNLARQTEGPSQKAAAKQRKVSNKQKT